MCVSPLKKKVGVKQYQRLLGYAARYWKGWLLILAVTLLSSALALLQPWPIKILVDHVLGAQALPEALARGAALLPGGGTVGGLLVCVVVAGLLIFAIDSLADVVLIFAWIRVGQRMVYDLSNDLFACLQRRSLLFYGRNSVGDLMSRITGDSWSVYIIVKTLLFTPGQALIMTVVMVVVMVRIDLHFTLLSLVVAPLMAVISFLFGRLIRTAAHARREIEGRIHSQVQQMLSGIPVVQAFTQEARELHRFQEFANTAIRAQQRSTSVSSLSVLSSGLITTFGTGIILWFGARRALDGQLSVGTILIFLSYLGSLQAQMQAFTGIYATLQATSASIERVLEVLEAEGEVADRPGATRLPKVQGHLGFEHVTFGYEAGRPVLRDLSLAVEAGQTLAIVGPTGSGKTTLASLVPRFFDPWHGRVTLDGHDVRGVQLTSLRQQVALVLQEPFLFPLTVAENIAYGRPEATREQIERAARAANAEDFIKGLADGYETVVGERGARLSGGERQRLAIARALLKDAPVLILDEPTSALDAEAEKSVLEALERLMAGRTTLIIAHRLSTIRRADRIVVIEGGRVAQEGTHTELLAQHGLYSRLHELQVRSVVVQT